MLHSRAFLTGAVAVATFFVCAFAVLDLPSLPDTDSYYHLAVANLYAEHGIVRELAWARFSVMHDGFGDKEPLFHALLIPFASANGGRLAIALLNALLAGAMTFVAVSAIGAWGAAIAPLIYLTAPYFWSRTIRLRPEVLSVTLMVLVIYAAARKRPLLAGLLALAFALTHTPWHALVGLAVLWFVFTREWRAPAAIAGGIAIGLLVHPHFPFSLGIWFLQNVVSLQRGAAIGMSTENVRPPLHLLLLHNAGWFLAIAVVLWMAKPWREMASRETLFFAIPAIVFAVMQLLWERMSTFFFPIATLAIVFWCGSRLLRKPLLAAALLAVIVTGPFTILSASRLATMLPDDVERDWEDFGKHVPPGAKIAATWGAADAYVFFAPQGRYLNVLDPAMMLEKDERAYWAQRALFDGTDPDPATTAKRVLDSDFIAFPKWEASALLNARVANDPRLQRVYDGYQTLLRIVPSDAFVGGGFVQSDLRKCATFEYALAEGEYELAPWGPTRVWVDGKFVAETKTARMAVLGKGRPISGGAVKIETCPALGRSGFYLVERRRLGG